LKTKLILLLLAVLIELALLRLGFWQLNRAQEKQAQQQQASEVLEKRQAIALQGFDPMSRRIEWAQGELRFLPEPLVLLDNQRREQAVGVSVYQLAMSSDGQALLVDLGWLPVPGNRQLPKPRACWRH
jgi:surfeit locus 1 family protein